MADETDEEVKIAAEHAAEEAEEAFNRPPIGAVVPIRDPDEEPFVFRFEVGPAILIQLLEKLRQTELQPIEDSLQAKHPGFYQLFLDDKSVYIGKTSRPIAERMDEHLWRLRGQVPYERMGCKFAYVEDPSLVDVAEGALIKFFLANEGAEWNRTGFGSKVPGYGRGKQKLSKWDEQFPPDLQWPVEAGNADARILYALITEIASGCPVTFSVPTQFRKRFREAHIDLINVPAATRPFNEWAEVVAEHLARGWTIEQWPAGWYIVPKKK